MEKKDIFILIGCILLFWILCVIAYFIDKSRFNDYKIHFISNLEALDDKYENGDAILIEAKGKYAMIDLGNTELLTPKNIIGYLQERKIDDLEFLLITHVHNDHAWNLKEIFKNNIHIKTLYIKEYDDSYTLETSISKYNRLMKLIDENRDLVDEIRFVNTKPEGTLYTFDNIDIKMTLYNNTRNANANKEENYNSVISLIEINNHKVLLTSDAYDTKQLNEIASGIGKVEVLKVPHHGLRGCALLDKKYTGDVVGKGSKVKSTALNDLKPDYYVITNSNKKIHNFIKDKKAKYNDLCISVLPKDNLYFVDESARALVFDFTGENIEIESE